MKCFQKLYIFILILIVLMAGCESKKITGDSKETQIKKSFVKTLDVYPTKNLEDFYDKEGYRDGEFKKGDKGTWVIRSEMTTELKNENMVSKGMVIRLNRNSRICTGEYFVRIVKEDSEGKVYSDERKYPVKIENNKIIPLKPIDDEKVKKEIEEFKFFVQYGNFKELENYKDGEVTYNPEAPIYSAQYQLKNSDYNVEQLRKRYNIPTKKAPKLLLKGSGNLKGSSVGYKNIEFTFVENKKENIYFTDSVYFNPSEDKYNY
ncbi:tandem-type lipoprotein Lpl7 [Staphylococcus aureus]|uniref:tandem-type lipoprotein Lpl7 n=2 Tax=Staphylococcus aureus TaxID=1280 RepID=UPI000452EDAD|nr:tandem-type lipoprotein Lpl7 [Staphylococcus aureus]EVG58700.1 tandem lipoprotein [Staphylococcus aureus OCMM6067]EVG61313.1 tandem lipoprotein [Staphylococcus aureus OCMM6066]EVI04728.1 tandem lipoprotein [Staphylococcus aureus OCMM6095]EXP37829.1 tandem lipoprotein [Staphylococcus aureus W25797]EYH41442.1 tandem lipoprotein [Staphylococcus aureus W25799]